MNPKYLKRIVANYVKDADVPYLETLREPEDAARYLKYLAFRDREEFVSLHLDKGNRVLCWDKVSVGCLDQTLVNPREVFRTALLSGAASLIIAHNHPSGRGEPSREDVDMTNVLRQAADLLGLRILDHLIIHGENDFYSFKQHGLM